MLIVGLTGKFGSGKDHIGKLVEQYLNDEYPSLKVMRFGFGDPLKMHVLTLYSDIVSFHEVYPALGDKPEHVRKLLQAEGDLMRSRNPYHWIEQYTHWSRMFERNGCDVLITCDVRVREELDHIVHDRNGIVCKVHAPTRVYTPRDRSLSTHVTECDLDNIPDDQYFYIFENDEDCLDIDTAKRRFTSFFERLVQN